MQVAIGTAKGWLTATGKKLVGFGHPEGVVLFVRPGHRLPVTQIQCIENAHEFFDIPQPKAEPKQETGKPGRPAKKN